jgi:hypothetical protein
MEKVLKGQATDAQIAEWKGTHKAGLYFVKNETDIAYFREPVIHDVEAALAVADDEKPFAAIKKFGELTMVGGSDAILNDDQMFLGARKELAKHWGGIEASSGNL